MTGTRPHYRLSYSRRAAHLRAAAWANPNARCTKCGRTMAELPRHQPSPANPDGAEPWWVAGHINPGQIDGPLQLECSHCSNDEGKLRREAITQPRSEDWYAPPR